MIEKFLHVFEQSYYSYSAARKSKDGYNSLINNCFGLISALALFYDLDESILMETVRYFYYNDRVVYFLYDKAPSDQYVEIMNTYYSIAKGEINLI